MAYNPATLMPITAGTRLGPYEVLSPLGFGGMGEVYRARDTRLERDVAIKVLPSHLSDNPEFRQRFEREAKAISQLSHPNICALYDVGNADGVEYLVMELIEGQSLADRLEKGALPIDLVTKFGIQIADALDKAHRQGIVHRDLKPGNVMITRSGVKLLDFGLAKLSVSTAAREISELSSLPTELTPAQPLTERGTVLGTFQYMAPEQLEGKEADSRSDIFAFGCVLYEMATGRKAFTGKSRASMIAAILEHDPAPISSIAPMTPPALDRVVKTCLAKDPDDRWQSAHDAKSELQWIAEAGSQAGAPAVVSSRRRNRERTAWIAAGLALIAAAAGWYRLLSRPSGAKRTVRLTLARPGNGRVSYFESLTPAPDGTAIAFIGHAPDGGQTLWVRPIDALDARELPGTEGARAPFWSPDSRFLAFFADGKLKKIASSGGPAETLADSPSIFGGSWGSKGVIVFEPRDLDGIFQVSAAGGTPKRVTTLAPEDEAHRWPVFLPDGDHFVFLVDANQTEGHWLALSSLSTGKITRMAHAISNIAVAPPDRIFYVKSGSLVSQRVDLEHARLAGDPEPDGDNILAIGDNHRFDFGVSRSGLLVYQTADPNLQFVWLDRAGHPQGAVGEPGRYGRFDIAPDGTRAAFERLDSDNRNENLWILDLSRGIVSRLTSGQSADFGPLWTPDGRTIFFASLRGGTNGDLYATPASGGGDDRKILGSGPGATPWSISLDGKTLLYETQGPTTRSDLWQLPVAGGAAARPVRATRFAETMGQFSPDGKWLAFVSDDAGRREVYLRSLADAGTQIRVSTSGGERPRWRRDGREIFFLSGDTLMSAAITLEPPPRSDPPRALFRFATPASDYDVSADGQRILVTAAPRDSAGPTAVAVLDGMEGSKKP